MILGLAVLLSYFLLVPLLRSWDMFNLGLLVDAVLGVNYHQLTVWQSNERLKECNGDLG